MRCAPRTLLSLAVGTYCSPLALRRRRRNEPGSFVGSERILDEIANKSAKRKRAGFIINGAPARQGTPIMNAEGEEVGVVTSGSHSPILKKGIGMCYVKVRDAGSLTPSLRPPVPLAHWLTLACGLSLAQPGLNKAGTELYVTLRKKQQPITITKMPFVPQNYYRGPGN